MVGGCMEGLVLELFLSIVDQMLPVVGASLPNTRWALPQAHLRVEPARVHAQGMVGAASGRRCRCVFVPLTMSAVT